MSDNSQTSNEPALVHTLYDRNFFYFAKERLNINYQVARMEIGIAIASKE
jgi:hypothetical protein